MSLEHLSASQPGLFAEPANGSAPPAPRVKSARSANRAAWWEQDLSRTATYLMGQARSDDERAFVERLYDEAMAEGPDFINYRGKSAFLAAPRLGIDPFNARLQGWARRTKDRSFGDETSLKDRRSRVSRKRRRKGVRAFHGPPGTS